MYLGFDPGQKHGFPLSFELKLRGASIEPGQVCWGSIFYLLVIPLNWTDPASQSASHKAQWALKRIADWGTLRDCWPSNSKLPQYIIKRAANRTQGRQNICCTKGHKCFHKWHSRRSIWKTRRTQEQLMAAKLYSNSITNIYSEIWLPLHPYLF